MYTWLAFLQPEQPVTEVGYTILDSTGNVLQERVVVPEPLPEPFPQDTYQALMSLPANCLILWDDGNDTPTYYRQAFNATVVAGYASGQDPGSYLTTQGYTSTRAGYLDVLNGIVASIWSAAQRTLTAFGFSVTATNLPTDYQQRGVAVTLPSGEDSSIASDVVTALTTQGLTTQRAAALDLLDTTISSRLALTTAIPTTGNTPNSVADALNAARAQGFGAWSVTGTTLTLYAPDATTIVRQFTLNDPASPTSRS